MKINKLVLIGVIIKLLFIQVKSSPLYAKDNIKYTWKSCVNAALIKNPDLLAARESIAQISAEKGVARSTLLPTINATAASSKNVIDDKPVLYSLGVSGKQLLFDGFKSMYDLKSADIEIKTAMYNYMIESAVIRCNLRKAFVMLNENRKKLKALQEIQKRKKHIMYLVKIRYEGGREHRGSYLAANADYLAAKANVHSMLRDISVSQKALACLTGLQATSEFDIEAGFSHLQTYKDKPDFTKLIMANPQYLMVASSLVSAKYKLKSSELSFSPKIYGTASAGKTGETIDNMKGEWSVGVEMSAPLFQGGQRWYEHSKTESELRQTQYKSESVKDKISQELESSWNTFVNAVEAVEVKKATLLAARERSKIGEARYSIGSITFDNWTIIESSHTSAKMSYLSACAEALYAEAEWIQLLGGTLENENTK